MRRLQKVDVDYKKNEKVKCHITQLHIKLKKHELNVKQKCGEIKQTIFTFLFLRISTSGNKILLFPESLLLAVRFKAIFL